MRKRSFALTLSVLMLLVLTIPTGVALAEDEYVFADSFEGTFTEIPDGWEYFTSATNGNTRLDTDNTTDGKNALRLTCDTTDIAVGVRSPKYPVEAGKTYVAAVDTFNHSGSCTLYLKFQDDTGKEVGTKSVPNAVAGNWTTITASDKAPETAVTSTIILYIIKNATGDITFDNVRIGTSVTVKPVSVVTNFDAPTQKEPSQSKLITPEGANLKYSPYNEQGDMLSDFSYAGFYAGEVELPEVQSLEVAATVSPSGDKSADDTKRIQDILDTAAQNVVPGKMTAVKFETGRYNINKNGLTLGSGVVLLGSGQGPKGTVFYAFDPVQYTVLKVAGGAPVKIGGDVILTDEYIKAGSREINVPEDDIGKFSVGDLITVYHPSTDEWSKAIEMSDVINSTGGQTAWKAGSVDMPTERTIAAINGTTITLDFPLLVPHDKTYSQTYIYLTDESKKTTDFGIENIRIESYYDGTPADENHANIGIGITNAKNGFIRNVSTKYLVLSAVRCGNKSKQITVQNVSFLQPVSQVAGSRRYSFACANTTQQILFTGCYSFDGRHDYECSFNVTGPVVFLDSVSDKGNTASEAHGTWSTGMLYDNLYQIPSGSRGFYAFANRGIYGTSLSQGWSAAGCVAWNCLTSTIIAHKPPLTYQNFMIGVWGQYLDSNSLDAKQFNITSYTGIYRTEKIRSNDSSFFETAANTPFVGDAYKESPTAPVEPRSLFKAQLALRMTGDYRNTKPNAPIIVSPRSDAEIDTASAEIIGIYQMGAEKVTIFIDDDPYEATLDSATNTFSASVELDDGYHKMYATQTIGGVESAKNADRFIKIGSGNEAFNPEYLSSIYPREKTALLTADERPTFDNYQGTAEVYDGPIRILVNGDRLESDVDPFETGGRVLVPMRAIFEKLGADVLWDEGTSSATATLGNRIVKITENDTTAYLNGESVTLDVPANITDGRFMVPVRFISESLGAKVDWIDKSKTVVVDMSSSSGAGVQSTLGVPNSLAIYDAVQSGDDGAGNSIEQAYDSNIATYWASSGLEYGDAWGMFDLGSEKTLDEVHIAFHQGDARVYTFAIEISKDGESFTKVIAEQKTSGTSKELEAYSLNGVTARYVKFIGLGNTVNAWNSVREIVFTENSNK